MFLQPGKKNNLLLKDLLISQENGNKEDNAQKPPNKKSKTEKTSTKNQLKGKRKDLPEVTRNMLENERQKLVSLYRDLKKSKGIQSDKS